MMKLQAMVRGQLVRRQANITLRRMQALVDAQRRARAERLRLLEDDGRQLTTTTPRPPQHPRSRKPLVSAASAFLKAIDSWHRKIIMRGWPCRRWWRGAPRRTSGSWRWTTAAARSTARRGRARGAAAAATRRRQAAPRRRPSRTSRRSPRRRRR
uniref:Uncharacterized protein n=1 Tax=Arundo donax TaxID=35708 RepID=A0A0A9DI42_ARUDO